MAILLRQTKTTLPLINQHALQNGDIVIGLESMSFVEVADVGEGNFSCISPYISMGCNEYIDQCRIHYKKIEESPRAIIALRESDGNYHLVAANTSFQKYRTMMTGEAVKDLAEKVKRLDSAPTTRQLQNFLEAY